MPHKHTIDIAQSYVYDAWNETDHADKLMQGARARLSEGNVEESLADLRLALEPASRSEHRIRMAIEYLEALEAEKERSACAS
jgi:hypothetical protein